MTTFTDKGVTTVPAVLPCSRCGLPVQAGDGPTGTAWHDCEWVLGKVELKSLEGLDATSRILARLELEVARRADQWSAKDIATLIDSVRALRDAERPANGGNGGFSGSLLGLLAR